MKVYRFVLEIHSSLFILALGTHARSASREPPFMSPIMPLCSNHEDGDVFKYWTRHFTQP